MHKKNVIKIDDIDFDKISVFKEKPYGTKNSFKYFIGYNDNDVIRPLCIKPPQMIDCVRNSQVNTTMSSKISCKKSLKKYCHLWKRVEKLLKIKSDSEPVYRDNDKYI